MALNHKQKFANYGDNNTINVMNTQMLVLFKKKTKLLNYLKENE